MEVLKIPIEKEKSSDETKQVPNLPLLFNALCPLLRLQIQPVQNEDGSYDTNAALGYEKVSEEVATTIATIAAQGVQDIKD